MVWGWAIWGMSLSSAKGCRSQDWKPDRRLFRGGLFVVALVAFAGWTIDGGEFVVPGEEAAEGLLRGQVRGPGRIGTQVLICHCPQTPGKSGFAEIAVLRGSICWQLINCFVNFHAYGILHKTDTKFPKSLPLYFMYVPVRTFSLPPHCIA